MNLVQPTKDRALCARKNDALQDRVFFVRYLETWYLPSTRSSVDLPGLVGKGKVHYVYEACG